MSGVWWLPDPVADPQRSPEALRARARDAALAAEVLTRDAVRARFDELRRLLPFELGAFAQRFVDDLADRPRRRGGEPARFSRDTVRCVDGAHRGVCARCTGG